MKRSGPLRRGKPLKRGKPLQRKAPMKRGAPLKRSGPIKSKPKPRRTDAERSLMARFAAGLDRSCGGCGVAARGVHLHAHHVLRRQVIERVLERRGLSPWEVFAAAWDPRWRMPLDQVCHGDHHSGMHRLPMRKVPKEALLIADIYDLRPELESEYTKE